MAVYRTVDAELSREEWKGELVFVFGKTKIDPSIPKKYVIRIPNSKHVSAEKFCSAIEPVLFKNGFTFVANEAVGKKDGPALQQLQTAIIGTWYGSHYFTTQTPYAPSPSLKNILRGLLDPSRSINQLRNMSWIFNFPIADKLRDKEISLPVVILMPGPSLREIGPELAEIAKRCLIICIGRSLRFCLDAGVEPDFVVQYDTNLEQRHFYEDIPVLKKTVLVALSSASIAEYAWKFRGVFFRASFNREFIDNDFVLRDGVEGSLLACMGLAEVLKAPTVYLAGCDFSWVAEGGKYCTAKGHEAVATRRSADYRVRSVAGQWELLDRSGGVVLSSVIYMASVAKAAEFAEAIKATTGADFFTMSATGLLSSGSFPVAELAAVSALSEIQRDAYLERIDSALSIKERVDVKRVFPWFRECATFLRQQELQCNIQKVDPGFKSEMNEEFFALLSNIRGIALKVPKDQNSVCVFLGQWAAAFEYATKIALAYILAERDSVPLLCSQAERAMLAKNVDLFFPVRSLAFWTLSGMADGYAYNGPQQVRDTDMVQWLRERNLVFVSDVIRQKYSYVFDMIGHEQIVFLPAFR